MSLLQLTKWSYSSLKLIFLVCYLQVLLHFRATSTVIKISPGYSIPAVFVFGDSIVDTGNNNNLPTWTKANYPPYGKDLPNGRATGRFSNGRVPSDFLASVLGIKEFLPPYADPNLEAEDLITGVCFASAGAGFDPLSSKILPAFSLSDQLSMFREYSKKLEGLVGDERAKFITANSLYIVVAGSNDLDNSYYASRIRKVQYNNINSYTDFMVQSASAFVQELYAAGGRRMAIFGAPPLGCVPSQRTLGGGIERGCVDEYNSAAQLYNGKLRANLDALQTLLPNSRVVYVDVYTPLLDIIQNSAKYGFEVANLGCCASGKIEVSFLCNKFVETCPNATNYVFWDSYHPTEATYKLLVDSLLQKFVSKFL